MDAYASAATIHADYFEQHCRNFAYISESGGNIRIASEKKNIAKAGNGNITHKKDLKRIESEKCILILKSGFALAFTHSRAPSRTIPFSEFGP